MAAAMNGIALRELVLVFYGGLFVFSNYRQQYNQQLLKLTPVTYVMTHDSVAVGEDGPTHEPVSAFNVLTLTLSSCRW